jgi:hypothetical protein
MRLRTEAQLQEVLDRELSWRLRELDYLKDQVRKAPPARKPAAIRASIPILYAHWEGFVKSGAEAILNFVVNQQRTFRQLLPCFVAHGFPKDIEHLTRSRRHGLRAQCIRQIVSSLDSVADFPWKNVIATESNLNSDVFVNICAAIGMASDKYQAKFNLIDKSLLQRRNAIAHGEYLDVDERGFLTLSDEVLALLRSIKTDMENYATLKEYLA